MRLSTFRDFLVCLQVLFRLCLCWCPAFFFKGNLSFRGKRSCADHRPASGKFPYKAAWLSCWMVFFALLGFIAPQQKICSTSCWKNFFLSLLLVLQKKKHEKQQKYSENVDRILIEANENRQVSFFLHSLKCGGEGYFRCYRPHLSGIQFEKGRGKIDKRNTCLCVPTGGTENSPREIHVIHRVHPRQKCFAS